MKYMWLVLLLWGCHLGPKIPTPERDITLPLYHVGTSHRFVKATIQERDWYFLIDTGANESAVTPKAAQEMALAVKYGGASINGIGGEADADSSLIPKMELGALSLKRLPVRVVSLSSAIFTAHDELLAGYLGASFWQNFQLGLDLAGGSLKLSSPGGAALFPGTPLKAKLQRQQETWVDTVIQDEALSLELDTGAEHTFLFRGKTSLKGAVGEMFVGGIGPGRNIRIETLLVPTLQLGEASAPNVSVIILDRERRKSGLLGADVLARFLVDLDPTRDTLYLWPRDATDTAIDLRPPPPPKKSGPPIIIEGDF
jgi:predicted aspartyl protease